MRISLKVTGADKVSKKFSKIASTLQSRIKGALSEIGDYLKDRFDLNFDVEGRVIGVSWAGGPYYNKLQRTGKMRRSFVKVLKPSEVMVYNSVEYAIYHQYGTRYMPARPLIRPSNEIRTGIIKIIQKEIKDILQQR